MGGGAQKEHANNIFQDHLHSNYDSGQILPSQGESSPRNTGLAGQYWVIPETNLTGQLAQLGAPLLQQLRRQLERWDVRLWEVPVVRFPLRHKVTTDEG